MVAEPGGVITVEVLDLALRVPYGVISNRHGKGALPGELPEAWEGRPDLRRWFNLGGEISVFTPARPGPTGPVGVLPAGAGEVTFPLTPFLGIMGTTRDVAGPVDSVPPTDTGGNLDVNELESIDSDCIDSICSEADSACWSDSDGLCSSDGDLLQRPCACVDDNEARTGPHLAKVITIKGPVSITYITV